MTMFEEWTWTKLYGWTCTLLVKWPGDDRYTIWSMETTPEPEGFGPGTATDIISKGEKPMTVLATRTYRPDTVSVSSWVAPTDQKSLRQWWKWAGPKTEYFATNDAEKLSIQRKLRDGAFTVSAEKRQGRFLLTAST